MTQNSLAPSQGAVIEFINHASVLFQDGQCGLLTDPWLFGEAFHRGWSLLVDCTEERIAEVLDRTTHIWLSHEHPDHFSPPFFQRFHDQICARGITVLFQKTRDHRVVDYLRSQGISVVELARGKRYDLHPDFSIWVEPVDVYDSALIAQIGGARVFNINDCPLASPEELGRFARKYGTCDVLLTQFSYAAWKGGKADVAWRRRAARYKIEVMHRQIAAFKPKACLLFANFVRFANVMNSYLNDAVNHPDQVIAEQDASPARLVFMAPGEAQNLAYLTQNADSLTFWRDIYAQIGAMPLMEYDASESIDSLAGLFHRYQQGLLRQNNRLLMHLARDFLPIHPFRPTVIKLFDLDVSVRVDILGAFEVVSDATVRADVGMHSSSLAFCFRFPFGLDTLFVNGCFEELSPGGFGRLAKCMGIGNMNAAGMRVAFSALTQMDVAVQLLRKLRSIQSTLARPKAPCAGQPTTDARFSPTGHTLIGTQEGAQPRQGSSSQP